ncbi:MAG TPA: diaminopimelate decarboxylase [Candidatus Avoscillospira avicola]|uniref:Diaminopimelate decarboxylase n=1 Tax=Candidatus Avoscillospira avicola TaxID=2840706 RepID=A0A9D1DH93_9FIRM|nr:diaminopimelate decarboxylase [Candidatus Avoscillospira avicola]
MLSSNLSVGENGHLYFRGHDTVALAREYGTPLYLLDEVRIRENMRMYRRAFQESFGPAAAPLYASKANCFKRIYEIAKEEGMGIDVVSSGEIYTALQAGFPLEQAYFHSNNKTDWDIAFAMDHRVGHFVVDNREELDAIARIAGEKGLRQKILLRLTPGIDPHTYEAVATGKVDSKFGTAIETGQAREMVRYTLSLPTIDLQGFHCHVGSQVFGEDVYERTADIMLTFIKDCRDEFGAALPVLDLGGGYGVRYVESDGFVDIPAAIARVAAHMKAVCERLGMEMPAVHMEPGRSIVADAGLTLYTVGTVKKITGYKNYVSIDGGMTDNPRYALYGSRYTVYLASRPEDPATLRCDVVGRCCESGDIIQPDVLLPEPKRGEILAVCTTGAYNYSMASNYNRLPRPAVVMLTETGHYLAVRRESLEDLVRNDV